MGHSIGISESYYKSTENEVLKDYLTAVNQLTISNESQIVRKRDCRIAEKSTDNEHILNWNHDTLRVMNQT